ncbi:MAG: carboxylesterase family protein, partial [Rhodospirillales bacterium]|nr:carboxylesterase family protein [Rhodospirillales bacterium]
VALLASLGLKPSEATRLTTVPVEKLVAALQTVTSGPQKANFSPVVDGHALPRQPWIPDAPPVSASVPLLVGSTATETTALLGAHDAALFHLDEAGLKARLAPWLPARDADRVLAGFRKLMPEATPSDLFFAITTDRRVRQQAWAQAERKAAQAAPPRTGAAASPGAAPANPSAGGAPVWLYELDWPTQVEGGQWRSPHSLDLAFVFDNVALSASMVGSGPEAQVMADRMSAAWLAFARSGDPNAPGLPHWPPFRTGERATMVFDTTTRVVNDHRGGERTLLAGLPLYRVFR